MDAFVDPNVEASLTAGLMDRYRAFLTDVFPAWGSNQADALVRQWKQGWLRLLVWRPASRESQGLAFTNRVSEGLQIHGLYLEPAGPDELTAFLSDVDEQGQGPLHALTDVLPGIDSPDQPRLLTPLGLWHRAKVLMQRDHSAGPLIPVEPGDGRMRRLRPKDSHAVVALYTRAFAKRPGEFWVWSSPDLNADARDYVGQYFHTDGNWTAEFVSEASAAWESGGELVGCVLVDRTEGRRPGVANLMVDPSHQRRGIGRRLMIEALQQLESRDPGPVELVAIKGGAPHRLYRELGFEEVAPPEGRREGHWVRGTLPMGVDP